MNHNNTQNLTITNREIQILRLVAEEYSSAQIGKQLFISSYTVITHRQNLMYKLNAKNTAGLIRKGFEHGFLKPNDRKSTAPLQ